MVSPKDSDAWRLVMENNLGIAFPGTAIADMGDGLARQKNGTGMRRSPESDTLFSWPVLAGQLDKFLRQTACV